MSWALVVIPSIPFLYQGTLSAKFNDILTVVGALEAPYWGSSPAASTWVRS